MILIGPSQAGKTSLIQRLHGETPYNQKTQMVVWHDDTIDTPGEYLENRRLYSALINSACEADIIGLVQNIDTDQSWFAPMFAQVFNKPTIGIISKADMLYDPHTKLIDESDQRIVYAKECLIQAGANPIFITSSIRGYGIAELITYLKTENNGL